MADLVQQLFLILGGVATTLSISVLSLVLGFAFGLVLAFSRWYGSRPFQILIDGFEKLFRGVPELVLMLTFFFAVGSYLPNPFKNALFTATFVLGMRSAANQSQIFRGAIRGVGEEQMLAARSLGLSRLQSVIHVIIPQVLIYSTPGLGSEYALLVKDSSYAFVIGALEMMTITSQIAKATSDYTSPFLLAAILYIMLTFPLATWLDTWGSRRKKQLGLK